MAVLSIFLFSTNSFAQLSHSFSQIPIGNSDINGFMRIDKVFYKMHLGSSDSVELYFKLSSDLRQEFKYMGAYWTIPFFDSYVEKISANRYRWIAPDLNVYMFVKSAKPDVGVKETYLLYSRNNLKLNVRKDSSICIEDTNDSKKRFVIKEGKLVLFCAGKDSDIFRISYANGNFPRSIYNVSANSTEVIFEYGRDKLLSKIVFPKIDKIVHITYADFNVRVQDLNKNGTSFVKSVSSLKFTDGKTEKYNYCALPEKIDRRVLDKNGGELKVKVFANRFEQSINNGESVGSIEWDASTGMIIADSGGNYAVRNPMLDRCSGEYFDSIFELDRKQSNRVKESRISYSKPEYKYPEIWDYSRRTAIKLTQDPYSGEQERTYYIGKPGKTMMKIRKIEKKQAGEKNWKSTFTRIYDDKGNLIREIDKDGHLKEFVFTGDNINGTYAEFIDGVKLKYDVYKNAVKVYEMKNIDGNIYEVILSEDFKETNVKKNGEEIRKYEN